MDSCLDVLAECLVGVVGELGDAGGQGGYGGMAEEVEHGEVEMEAVAEAAVHLGKEEGMASEVEEVLIEADAVDAEGFLPDGGDLLFEFALRGGA